jgi:D-3-phosphoglycerate dehydrogenase / 2-oxoglutarate reductase
VYNPVTAIQLAHSTYQEHATMKVTVVDPLSPQAIQDLKSLGMDVEICSGLTADTLPGKLANTDILVVRSTKVTAAAIEAASQLSLIVRAGAGVDNIDLVAASSRGIYVANCPGKNTAAVAELTIGLLIAADRRIVQASKSMQDGQWKKKEFGKARGLAGRTLGILGFGAIGRAVADRALALEMKVIAYSRSLTPEIAEQAGVEFASTPIELAACDAVSVHMAYSRETHHAVNRDFVAAMKPNAILINTSRGSLMDTQAVRDGIMTKGLRVGLDVFENEPAGADESWPDTELATITTCTPHIGASTDQASEAIASEVVRIVDAFLKTSHPPGTVNLCARSPATHRLVVRHYNRVGVLATVLDGLRAEGINVEEVENLVFAGANAACCSMLLDRIPSAELIASLKSAPNILHVLLNACED